MTPEEHRNEHVKLMAGWINTVAAGILTAGTFVPAAQFIFGLLPKDVDNGLVVGIGWVCLGAGLCLHLVGQLVLRMLR